nr:MAG TPA: protein of unknown function (DUF4719) [Caudoviricetes sp.]DAZ38289.1 MAG TPA: protein of unknown function (DUF4719) [Caudoviricetes sp.]
MGTSTTLVSVTLINGLLFTIWYFLVRIFLKSKCQNLTQPLR